MIRFESILPENVRFTPVKVPRVEDLTLNHSIMNYKQLKPGRRYLRHWGTYLKPQDHLGGYPEAPSIG